MASVYSRLAPQTNQAPVGLPRRVFLDRCGHRVVLQGKGEVEEPKAILPPPIVGPTEFSKAVMDSLKGYELTWLDRDESENFAQKHDEDLAREARIRLAFVSQ